MIYAHQPRCHYQKRCKLGIRRPHPRFRPWTKEEDALLGTMPDSKLAQQLGRTFEAVKVRRRQHEIENPNPKLILWTPGEEALLGTMPDSELARQLGRTKVAIEKRRAKRRIQPFS